MTVLRNVSMFLGVTLCLAGGAAQAALLDRGGGLIYDNVLDITWLKDANYAATQYAATGGAQGDADGLMQWSAANTWASSLDISRFAGESLTGWRLAANTPVGADWNYNNSNDGSTDWGFNIISPRSELSYMYYVNLGLKGYYSPTGAYQPDFGVFGNGTVGGQKDVGPVKNLQSYAYLSGTAYAPGPANYAWIFVTADGGQVGFEDNGWYAWAVRPGDVAAVPEPGSLMLVGLALAGLASMRRRRPLGV